MIGQTIGNITVIEKLGEGGMGEVYRGIDNTLERDVAIKILLPTLVNRLDIVERFRQEGITLGRLNHPNIATLYSLIPRQNQNDYWMIMEYVHGLRLDQIITQVGPLPFQYASRLIVQALDGLEHASKYSVVHRDIKPGNLMVTAECNLKIMDFGLAQAIWTSNLTQKGTIMGTFAYMSPEQILCTNDKDKDKNIDSRSDLYSLGIVFYEMLTGKVPFQSESEFHLMRLQIEEIPLSPRELCANIPEEIEEIVLKSLSKDRDDRFLSPVEFRDKLLPYQASQHDLIKYLSPKINEKLDPKSFEITKRLSISRSPKTNSNGQSRTVNSSKMLIGVLLSVLITLSIIAIRVSSRKQNSTDDQTRPVETPQPTPNFSDGSTPIPTITPEENTLTEQWKRYCESCDDRLMPLFTPQGTMSQSLSPENVRNQFCQGVNRCRKTKPDNVDELIKQLSPQ